MRRRSAAPRGGDDGSPDRALWVLGLLLSEREREHVLGDLYEEHGRHVLPRLGEAAARRWLFRQALASLFPLLWRRLLCAAARLLSAPSPARLQPVPKGVLMFEKALLDTDGGSLPGRGWRALPLAIGIHLFLIAGATFAHIWRVDELAEPTIRDEISLPVVLQASKPAGGQQGGRRPQEARRPAAPAPVRTTTSVRVRLPRPIQPAGALAAAPIPTDLPEMPELSMAFDAPQGFGDPSVTEVDTGAWQGGTGQGEGPGIGPGSGIGPGGGEGPIAVDGDVRKPELLHQVTPRYTQAARLAKIQGTVVVEAIIDRSGRVTHARVLKGLPAGLSESAIEAVEQWRFKPATLKGQPVTVYFTLTVHFALR
jgi:periplasmic protein TonB